MILRKQPTVRRLCLVVDIERYSRHDNIVQYNMQRRLAGIVDEGLRSAQVAKSRTDKQASGDGLLALMPHGVDEAVAVPGLIRGIAEGLDNDHKRSTKAKEPRLRLRAALSQGIVRRGKMGFVGNAVVSVSHIVDSEQVRNIFGSDPDADLCFAVSDDLYRDVVMQGFRAVPPGRFTQVRVHNPSKEFDAIAWVWAFQASALPPDPDPPVPIGLIVGTAVGGAAATVVGEEVWARHVEHQIDHEQYDEHAHGTHDDHADHDHTDHDHTDHDHDQHETEIDHHDYGHHDVDDGHFDQM